MTKIKKYVIYITSFLLSLALAVGITFTALQISSKRDDNLFFDEIEQINLLVDEKKYDDAKIRLLQIKEDLKSNFWNKKIISNKKAVIELMKKKLGDDIDEKVIEKYSSKAENYGDFSLVKEALLRLLFLEKDLSEKEKFRWEHGMQRLHLLTTLRSDLKNKDLLPKQLFDFYIKNLASFSHKLDLETIFIIMAAA
jgi:hypothetical protein